MLQQISSTAKPFNASAAQACGASCCSSAGKSPSPASSLGKDVSKVVKASEVKAQKNRLFALKYASAKALFVAGSPLGKRVSQCCYVAHAPEVHLQKRVHADGSTSAGVSGVVTCKSVWACPVCSARISAERCKEMNHLLSWSRVKGYSVAMLTLTVQHTRRDALPDLLGGIKKALQGLRQSSVWRRLALVGSVTGTEVTHGANGWHPHFHIIVVMQNGCDAVSELETLRRVWGRCLERQGMTCGQAGFQVQDATQAGAYVTKFGAAEEIALSGNKTARGNSRTPFQILGDLAEGCTKSAALWVEYCEAFKGRRQLIWSDGLRAKCDVEQEIEEQKQADKAETSVEVVRVWSGSSLAWRDARRRLAALLSAAILGDDLDHAEFGQTDAVRWRSELQNSSVLE